MDSTNVADKPHAVFIPCPLQGHIHPVLRLAKLFHRRGFHVTVINAEFIKKCLFKHGHPPHLPPDFSFETYPDHVLPDSDGVSPNLHSLRDASRDRFSELVRNVVLRINNQDREVVPRVSCIVADAMMPYAIDVAHEIGVPAFVFWPASACSLMVCLLYLRVNEKGPPPVTDDNMNNIIDWVPGIKNVRLRDLAFVDASKCDFPMKEMSESLKDASVIINTFDSLEHDVLSALSSMFSHVYTIGPLQMLETFEANDNL